LFYWSECSVIQQIFNPFIDNLYMYENWLTIFSGSPPNLIFMVYRNKITIWSKKK
jgi:hypothetical protein